MTTNTDTLRKEDWEPYFEKWVSQGRSEEQIYGVRNFMTGQGAIMLKELIGQAVVKEWSKHVKG